MTSAVVVWVRKMDTFEAVKAQKVSIAEHRPDEPTEFNSSTFIGGLIHSQRPNDWRMRSERRCHRSPKSLFCVYPATMTSRPRSHCKRDAEMRRLFVEVLATILSIMPELGFVDFYAA